MSSEWGKQSQKPGNSYPPAQFSDNSTLDNNKFIDLIQHTQFSVLFRSQAQQGLSLDLLVGAQVEAQLL